MQPFDQYYAKTKVSTFRNVPANLEMEEPPLFLLLLLDGTTRSGRDGRAAGV